MTDEKPRYWIEWTKGDLRLMRKTQRFPYHSWCAGHFTSMDFVESYVKELETDAVGWRAALEAWKAQEAKNG